jgi:hydrogenase maturation protease
MTRPIPLQKGDRVVLRPQPRGDVFDLALAGRTAVVSSIEQDLEGRLYVAVIVDDDPGVSIGPRRPGHRFFFAEGEVERLGPADPATAGTGLPTILVAGIGNIFLGDDAFGVEVAQRLSRRELPDGVRVADYGIRGFDLAYALADDPDHVILVDAYRRGKAPGTLYVVEPDLAELDQADPEPSIVDAHTMHPLGVLRLARSMGAPLRHVLLVGCEPATLGPEEGHMGLSEPVEAALDQAVSVIESLVARLRTEAELSSATPTSP